MVKIERINIAGEYVDSLGKCLYGSELPVNNQISASAPCYAIAMQHHHAIVRLIDGNLCASAFAMSRVMFDAYMRGLWFHLCATEDQRQKFLKKNIKWEPPKTWEMLHNIINSLELNQNTFSTGLSEIRKQTSNTLNTYTHTGDLQIQRWFTADTIEPNYPSEEIEEILKFAELIGSLAAIAFATLTNDEQICHQVVKITEEHNIALLNLSN